MPTEHNLKQLDHIRFACKSAVLFADLKVLRTDSLQRVNVSIESNANRKATLRLVGPAEISKRLRDATQRRAGNGALEGVIMSAAFTKCRSTGPRNETRSDRRRAFEPALEVINSCLRFALT